MNAYRNYPHSSTAYNWTKIGPNDISVEYKYEDEYNPRETPFISYHVSLKEDGSGSDGRAESSPKESTSMRLNTTPNPIVLLERLSSESIKAACSRPNSRKGNGSGGIKRRMSATNPRSGRSQANFTRPDGLACGVCRRIFASKGNLKSHLKIHTGIRNHECPICLRRFVRVDTLKNHMKVHRAGAILRCPTCHIIFDRLKDWRCHNLKHHSHKRSHICCTFCSKSFKSIVYRDIHEGIHPPRNSEVSRPFYRMIRILNFKLSCHKRKEKSTARFFLDKLKLMRRKFLQIRRSKLLRKIIWGKFELNLQAKSQFKCEFCKKYYRKKWSLDVHRNNMHTREQKFSCRLCGIVFYANSLKTNHIRRSHPEYADILITPRKIKSTVKKFRRRGYLLASNFAYEEMEKTFKESGEEEQMEEKQVKIQAKRYEPQHWCNLCQEEYFNEDFLKKHQEVHVQGIPKYQYNCDSCLKCSQRRGSLILSREEYKEMLLKEKRDRKRACTRRRSNNSLYEEDLDFEPDWEGQGEEEEIMKGGAVHLSRVRTEAKEITLKCSACYKFGQDEPIIGKRKITMNIRKRKCVGKQLRNPHKQIQSEFREVISRPKPNSEIPPANPKILAGFREADSVEKERTSPIKIFQKMSEMHEYNMISPLVKELFPEEVLAGRVLRLLLSLRISERFQLLQHTDELHARILKENLFLDGEKSM